MKTNDVRAMMAGAEKAGRLVAGGAAAVAKAHDEMLTRGRLRAALSLAGGILDLMGHGDSRRPQQVEIIEARVIDAEPKTRKK
jgi:hypothetical protein